MIAESLCPNREALAKPDMLQPGSRIVLICDGLDGNGVNASYSPVINGVKTSLENVHRVLNQRGYETILVNPSQYMNVPLPAYPDFRLALVDPHQLRSKLIALQPNGIFNMSPEGGIGFSSLRACGHFPFNNLVSTGKRLPYTASYTTNLDQYPADYIQTDRYPINCTYSLINN